jgi:hypothetical protein
MVTHVCRSIGCLALLFLLSVGLGCTPQETQAVQPELDQADSTPARAVSQGGNALDDISVFPSFVPPLGFGADVTDCQLSDDPYSTCI